MARVATLITTALLLFAASSAASAYSPIKPRQSETDRMRDYCLVLVDTDSKSELAKTADSIVLQGGRVGVLLPPRAMLAWISPKLAGRLAGRHRISSIHRSAVSRVLPQFRDPDTQLAIRMFNEIISRRRTQQTGDRLETQPDLALKPMVECGLPTPPINRTDVIRNLQSMGASSSVEAMQSQITPQLLDNSNVMDGSVAVAVFLVESNGGWDPNVYNWSKADQITAIAEVVEGLNWWVDQSLAFDLERPLRFTVIPYFANNPVSQQPYEPILHEGRREVLWVDQIMTNVGSTHGDQLAKVAAFDRRIRDENNTDWAFSIFLTYNPAPAPTSYFDGRASWGYLGGPYINLLWRSFGWSLSRIISHEVGHMFYACDEYVQVNFQTCDCNCVPDHRRTAVNGNCEASGCNPLGSVQCMMRVNEFAVCDWTAAQIGWVDGIHHRPIPDVPIGLGAVASTPTEVILTWEDTATGEDGFQIERRDGPAGSFSLVGTRGPNSINYIDNRLISGSSYDYRIRAFNFTGASNYSAEISVTTPLIRAPLEVATASLPDATAAGLYSRTLTAAGGKSPYSWVVQGGGLPDGIRLSPTGELVGTPTTNGVWNFVMQVTDSEGDRVSKALSLAVKPSPVLAIATTELALGSVGAQYSQNLIASGGQAPYLWSIRAGSLFEGLTLKQAGSIDGVPERVGVVSFVLTVTDSAGATADRSLSIRVYPSSAPLSFEAGAAPTGALNEEYSHTLKAIGGIPPYRFNLFKGRLPDGLTLTESGVIQGRPTNVGTTTFRVEVFDQIGQFDRIKIKITIDPAPELSISTGSQLPAAIVGLPYGIQLEGRGGTPPYNWSRKPKKKKFGVMPPGLVLSADGQISGVPTEAGAFSFTVRVNDATGKVVSKPFTVEVGPPPP